MKQITVAVSSCFLLPTRYDGKKQDKPEITAVLELLKANNVNIIPFCPEQLGGMTTPRTPAEIQGELVINKNGFDVTSQFMRGAELTLAGCQKLDVDFAVLKERSPSCGVHVIYDGHHRGRIQDGVGKTTEKLLANGIQVFSENDIINIRQYLKELHGS